MNRERFAAVALPKRRRDPLPAPGALRTNRSAGALCRRARGAGTGRGGLRRPGKPAPRPRRLLGCAVELVLREGERDERATAPHRSDAAELGDRRREARLSRQPPCGGRCRRRPAARELTRQIGETRALYRSPPRCSPAAWRHWRRRLIRPTGGAFQPSRSSRQRCRRHAGGTAPKASGRAAGAHNCCVSRNGAGRSSNTAHQLAQQGVRLVHQAKRARRFAGSSLRARTAPAAVTARASPSTTAAGRSPSISDLLAAMTRTGSAS